MTALVTFCVKDKSRIVLVRRSKGVRMKGIVFNLLEGCVTEQYGEDMWDDLLEEARLDGAYTSLGNYADADFVALVNTASKALALPTGDLQRWFGRSAMPSLARLYPEFFEKHTRTSGFVLTLNDIIHPEVRKLYPGADVPNFRFDVESDTKITMGYESARKMCSFAEGLIEGAAAHFGEQVVIEQPTCMKHGAEECLLVCSFARASHDG